MDEDNNLTPLDPAHITVSRIATSLFLLPFLIGAVVLEMEHVLRYGSILIPVLIVAIYLGWFMPARRYRRWRYQLGSDRLRVVHGYMFHSDTVVPFSRVQHIDVQQGPIQRRYDLATLTVHTAGNHNSTVSLPGLLHADALVMREKIRSHIRQDFH